MHLPFNKYQGTGNDFIIIDNRKPVFNPADQKLISRLCDRRFGIGADGLILICSDDHYAYEMVYFNSDGKVGSMCGNGGRCAADFTIRSGIAGADHLFRAADGIHHAISADGVIRLGMQDPKEITLIDGNYFINTGSPHYIIFRTAIDDTDVFGEGRKIRYSGKFATGGTNVNFAEPGNGWLYVRTYERGVEDETLSCGTGVTASAIASVLTGHFDSAPVRVRTKGGDLTVEFNVMDNSISGVHLSGPATFVFTGTIEI